LVAALNEVVAPFVPPEQGVDRPWREALEAAPEFGPLERRTFAYEQQLDEEGLVGRAASISWIARLDDTERERVLGEIRELARSQAEPLVLPHSTEAYLCTRLDAGARES
jgi:hypothetical protein